MNKINSEMYQLLENMSKMSQDEIISFVTVTEGESQFQKAFQNSVKSILSDENDEANEILEEPKKIDLWYIYCATGCTCCSYENFYQGFYKSEEEANEVVAEYMKGNGNPLASQYARYGRYSVCKCEAEILPDGRMIAEDQIFDDIDYFGHLDF